MEWLRGLELLFETDALFRLISLGVLTLTVFALSFALYALVLRLRNRWRTDLWARLEEAWEEPLLSALEDPDRLPEVWERVEDRHGLLFVDYVLRFARRVRGPEEDVLRRAAEPYLESVAARTRGGTVESRTRAVQTLGVLGISSHPDVVVSALDDPSPLVAMVAARALAREARPEFVGDVLEHLDRFRTWRPSFLASMLASIGPGAAPTLRSAIEEARLPPGVLAVAADALREIADLESADVAARALERARDPELLAALLRLLGEVGRPEHLPAVRSYTDSPHPFVRAHALTALGTLGDEGDLPTLLEGLGDPSPWVALHAARGVRSAGGSEPLRDFAASRDPRAHVVLQVLEEEKGG